MSNIFIKSEVEDRLVWSTDVLRQYEAAKTLGHKVSVKSPYHDGNELLRRGNLVFNYTDEELLELIKCSKDILYFAENYATVTTDEGIRRVQMRDYQKKILKNLQDNRFNIILSSRQVGKCVAGESKVIESSESVDRNVRIDLLYYREKIKNNKGKWIDRLKLKILEAIDSLESKNV